MFFINKKMMLCASMGGDEKDYIKMINTNLIMIRCPHLADLEYARFSDGYGNNIPNMNSTIVNLRLLAFDSNKIGYVGRCEKCGKIYYKEI